MFGGAKARWPSLPVESAALGGDAGGSSWTSLVSTAYQINAQVSNQGWSYNSPDEEQQRGHRKWSEEDNLRLVSAWLNNLNNPIDENSKKCDQYWNKIAEEFNSNTTRDEKRIASQCKRHQRKMNIKDVLFNGC